MKWELGDNASDAIRFLLLGVGVLLLFRLLYAGIAFWLHPPLTLDLPVAIDSFRNGYLLSDHRTLVVGGTGLTERLALAAAITAGCTLLVTALAALIARVIGRSANAAAVAAARSTLFVAGAWCFFSALALPPHSIRIGNDELISITRPALMDELSLPLPAAHVYIDRSTIDSLVLRSVASSTAPNGWVEELEAIHGPGRTTIARLAPADADREAGRSRARARLQRLAELLSR